jgi:HK97 family phage portal protein
MGFEQVFQKREISFQTLWGSGADVNQSTLSGVSVDQNNALSIAAVHSAVSLIADTISTLPVDCFVRRDGNREPFLPKPSWVAQPDVNFAGHSVFYNSLLVSLLIDGNAFVRVYSRGSAGAPLDTNGNVVNLVVLNPQDVEIKRNDQGRLLFTVKGERGALTSEDILYVPDLLRPGTIRGVSRVQGLRENLGLSKALEAYAATFFGGGTTLAGVIEVEGNLSREQAESLRGSFDTAHGGWRKSGRTGILSGGAKFKPTQADPEKSQALEARRMAVEDVARIWRIPSHMLNLPGTNTYSSVEQNMIGFTTHTLRPYVSKIEDIMSSLMSRVPGGETAFVKFNMSGLLRADIQTRYAAYSTGIQSGFLAINDIRRLEDMSPQDGEAAEAVRVPLANVNLSEAGVKAQREKVQMARDLVFAGFNPAEALEMVGLPPVKHTGLPSVQLQGVAQVDPDDPDSPYKDEVS